MYDLINNTKKTRKTRRELKLEACWMVVVRWWMQAIYAGTTFWIDWTYLSVRHLFIMSSLSKKLEQIQVGNEVEDVNMEVDHTENMPPSNMKRWDLSDFFKTICLYQ